MVVTRAIFGLSGPELNDRERQFFKRTNPWGIILFRRNIQNRKQLTELCCSLRSLTGRDDLPILIDQEGGRVQRMGPPEWRAFPSAAMLGKIYEKDPVRGRELIRLNARLIAYDLKEVGISVNCAPMLDIRTDKANEDVIGDRSFSMESDAVSVMGRAYAEGLLAGGILPVIKHMPGHGRAEVDSHEKLPIVTASLEDLQNTDFKPFMALKDMPVAMPAHIVYSSFDKEYPATVSSVMIREIIRNSMGYRGLLITDDLSMKALQGSFDERAANAYKAGCDIALHCNGNMDEMEELAEALLPLDGKPALRASIALERIAHTVEPLDIVRVTDFMKKELSELAMV